VRALILAKYAALSDAKVATKGAELQDRERWSMAW
jgi:hypothetical protein